MVLRGRDRTGSLVDHKTAIIVLFIITSKKPFGNLPEVVVQLLSTAIHILGIDLHLSLIHICSFGRSMHDVAQNDIAMVINAMATRSATIQARCV